MQNKRLKLKGLKQVRQLQAPPLPAALAMPSLKALSSMTKEEIVSELEEHQTAGWNPKMSVIELRAILKEVRKIQNPEQEELKGLTSKKLAELQEQYRRLLGEDPGDRTRGLLMASIRNYVMGTEIPTATSSTAAKAATETPKPKGKAKPEAKAKPKVEAAKPSAVKLPMRPEPGKGTEMNFSDPSLLVVGFGKYKGTSYEEMEKTYPQYCNWVIQTFEIEDECDPRLKHFAVYLLKKGFGGRTPTDQEDQPAKETEEKKDTDMDDAWGQEL